MTAPRRRRRSSYVVAAVAVLAVVGLGAAVVALAPGSADPAPVATDPVSATAAAQPSAPPSSVQPPAAQPSSTPTRSTTTDALEPTRIAIPSIDVDASMTELGIAAGGEVEVPSDARQVGWVDTTPTPGQQGSSVLAGHRDSDTGPAVFYELASVRPGDDIDVTLRDGTVSRFTVDGVETYPQDDFPTDQVYGPVPGPVLRLITCGGAFDRDAGGYQDNVVVYAS